MSSVRYHVGAALAITALATIAEWAPPALAATPAAPAVGLASVNPPVPEAQVVASYAATYRVPASVALQRLLLQDRAGNLVTQARGALGDAYAGVWFDNSTGTFHIDVAPPPPLSAPARANTLATAAQVASDLQIDAETEVDSVGTSTASLATAQAGIDHSLSDLEVHDELQTAPDVVHDVLDLYVAADSSQSDQQRIEDTAAAAGVPTKVIVRPSADFEIKSATCVFPNCDRPIHGGVSIESYSGGYEYLCSAGYLAQANFSPPDWYVITAGHCAAPSSTWYAQDSGGTQYKLGTMNLAIWNIDGDYARIDTHGSPYWGLGAIGAVSAFWGINLDYPTYYTGGWSVPGQYGCRTGVAEAQAQCGTILQNGMTITYGGVTVAGEFEVSACASPGDSGGPFMLNYWPVGITTALNVPCGQDGAVSYYSEVMNAQMPQNLNLTIATIYNT